MRDASTPKLKLTAKIFHVHSFVVLFSYFFLLMWQFKILIGCFSFTLFDELERHIFKKFDQTNMFRILLYTLSNLFDSTNLIKLI